MTPFPKAPVPVTLTGEEWTAILARIAKGAPGLSPYGLDVYRRAQDKLCMQITAASSRCDGNEVAAGTLRLVE